MVIDAVGANVNAILAQVAPTVIPPRQAVKPVVAIDRINNSTTSGDYGAASQNAVTAPIVTSSFFGHCEAAPQLAKGSPQATQAFEAAASYDGDSSSQDMPLDAPVQTHGHARKEPDEVLAG